MIKIQDIILALGLEIDDQDHSELYETVNKISFDSRTLEKDDIFIALKGEKTDGHHHLKEAIAQGAKVLIIDNEKFVEDCLGHTFFIVEDAYDALEQLGYMYRSKISKEMEIIAVTGSIGKTTLKDFLCTILSNVGPCIASPKNYNNHIGVPVSLSGIKEDSKFGIFEIGMNNPGEIAPLAEIVAPHMAIITYIGDSHVGNMGSIDAIAQEKAAIFEGLQKNGIAIIPHDCSYKNILQSKGQEKTSQIFTVGKSEGADGQLLEYFYVKNGIHIKAKIFGDIYEWFMPVFGEHYAILAVFAIVACIKIGISFEKIKPFIEKLEALPGRGKVSEILTKNGKKLTVIDDSYNANLTSMKASLDILSRMDGNKKIAVLGAIGELGNFSKDIHENLAEHLNTLKLSHVFMTGESMKQTACRLSSTISYDHAENIGQLMENISQTLDEGDVILLKGSNSNQLWKVLSHLTA
jgi:UDP-N-acetylmuramoyl-tripeptide--D-alanyl-D-alanine ligase